MLPEAGTESGGEAVQVVGVRVNRDVSSLLSVGPRFNFLLFPLVPKYPGIVLPGWAKSFHLGNVSWLQGPKADDRC